MFSSENVHNHIILQVTSHGYIIRFRSRLFKVLYYSLYSLDWVSTKQALQCSHHYHFREQSRIWPGPRNRRAVGAACPHNSGAMGAVPPQLFNVLGTIGAVVLPKLSVLGHKGKLNGRKHFSEIPPLSLAWLVPAPLAPWISLTMNNESRRITDNKIPSCQLAIYESALDFHFYFYYYFLSVSTTSEGRLFYNVQCDSLIFFIFCCVLYFTLRLELKSALLWYVYHGLL